EEMLFRALWNLSDEELRKLLLIDTTSMYFEANADDEELAELEADWAAYDAGKREKPPHRPRPSTVNEPAMRMRGHNKDGHPGDPQVVIASVCLPNGLVLRHTVHPGNTADVTIAADLVETMALPEEADVKLWVSDG